MDGKSAKLLENKAEILWDYASGVSASELGRRWECNHTLIARFVKKHAEVRQARVRESNKEAILELHRQGYSAYAINKKLGLTKNTAARALADAGVDISGGEKKRADPLVGHREEITRRYLAGEGTYLLGKAFHCQDSTILRSLKRWGVEIRRTGTEQEE